jgi:small nuclear ribonucleoprotein (snRNP)-like protein
MTKPFSNSVDLFMGKNVKVEVETGFTVEGKLVGFEGSVKGMAHKPNILILEHRSVKRVLRGDFIKICEVS